VKISEHIRNAGLVTLLGATLSLGLGMNANAKEVNPNGWNVPSLEGYTKVREKWQDGDDDPNTGVDGKETLYEIFNKEGTGIITKYSTAKATFAWAKAKNPFDPDAYIIIDSDCDGVFEEKYNFNETFNMPGCAK